MSQAGEKSSAADPHQRSEQNQRSGQMRSCGTPAIMQYQQQHYRPDQIELLLYAERPGVLRQPQIICEEVIAIKEQGRCEVLRTERNMFVQAEAKRKSKIDQQRRQNAERLLR